MPLFTRIQELEAAFREGMGCAVGFVEGMGFLFRVPPSDADAWKKSSIKRHAEEGHSVESAQVSTLFAEAVSLRMKNHELLKLVRGFSQENPLDAHGACIWCRRHESLTHLEDCPLQRGRDILEAEATHPTPDGKED